MAKDSVQSVLITYRDVLNVMPIHAVNATKNTIHKNQYASFAVETFLSVLFVQIRTLAHNVQVRRFSYRAINAHRVALSTMNARPVKQEMSVSLAKMNQNLSKKTNAHLVALSTNTAPDASKKTNVWHAIVKNLQ